MDENRFSLNKQLRNSKLSSVSHNSSSSNSVRSFNSTNKANTQCHRTRKMKYFEIYNQVKEEMKKNNVDKKKPNTQYNQKRQELLDNLYIKNITQLNNYYEKNYPNIEIQGTKDLEGLYKKDLSSEIKNNQNNFIENMPLKYRNPQLNINCEKLNLTPIPYIQNKNFMNDLEKEEYDKAKEKSVFIRKVEYTHAKPPPKNNTGFNFSQNNNECIGYKLNNIIKAAKLIQKWFRFLKKIKVNNNKYKKRNKKIENNKKINKDLIDYEKESLVLNENNINILNNEYNNNNYENKQLKLNNFINQNTNNLSLDDGKFIKNNKSNFSFQLNKTKTSDESNIKLKPINNNCYITRGEIVLINNSPDMYDLNLIQKRVKKFLKNKNKISPYKIFKQLQRKENEKEKEKEKTKKSDITNESNHSSEQNFSDFMNYSEKIYEKKRIISKLDSLQSIHNMSIQEKEKTISDKFFKKQFNNDNESDSSLNDENIFKNKNINNIEPELNLLNFSFNSEKNKNDMNDEDKIIQIKKNSNKNFYISKNIFCNSSDVIVKLTSLQTNIKNFLNKNNNKNIYTENSSDTNLNNESKNNFKNSFAIENNNFEMHPYKKSAKTKILGVLLNKYNKKLNKEVNQNINLYHDKNNEKNKIMKIFKTKLAITLVKILQNHLKQLFNDIYKYEIVYYKRKKILVKIFNNINSRLKKYFHRWSKRPIKLLIYKSKSVKYYNSLFILNNNIKKLIKSIYNVFAGKNFYILIINYLYENNINFMNNKIFLLLNNKRKLKIFYKISKSINQNKNKEENLDNLNLVEYFKSLQNINNNKLNSLEKIEEEKEEIKKLKEEEKEEEIEDPEEKEEPEEREKENEEQEQEEKEENGEENVEQSKREENGEDNGEENEEQEPEENYDAEGEEKEENEENKEIEEIEEEENEESINK